MYVVRSGDYRNIPQDSMERAEYYLEQMRMYLEVNKVSKEYKDIEIIFNAMMNIMAETNFKIIASCLFDTGKRVNCSSIKSAQFWSEFLRFMHWKTTGRTY